MKLRLWTRIIILLPYQQAISVENFFLHDPISPNSFEDWSNFASYWDSDHHSATGASDVVLPNSFENPHHPSTTVTHNQNEPGASGVQPRNSHHSLSPINSVEERDESSQAFTNPTGSASSVNPTGFHQNHDFSTLSVPNYHHLPEKHTHLEGSEPSKAEEIANRPGKLLSLNPTANSIFPVNHQQMGYNFVYYLVDFEPSNIDGQLVVEALNHLKVEGIKFFTHPGFAVDNPKAGTKFQQKMFYLNAFSSKDVDGFFEFFNYWCRCVYKEKESRFQSRKKEKLTYFHRIWEEFNLDPKLSRKKPSIITAYKQSVLPQFSDYGLTLRNRIKENLSRDPKECRGKLKIFDKAKMIFPLYLFYVDMIGTILPAERLDKKGELLQSERKTAGAAFFELLELAILGNNAKLRTKSGDQIVVIEEVIKFLGKKRGGAQNHGLPLKWKALHYWILSSRSSLLKKGHIDRIKAFFNALCFSLVNNV